MILHSDESTTFIAVADLEGVQAVASKPPLDPNYFIFRLNFKRFCVKLDKRTSLSMDKPSSGMYFVQVCYSFLVPEFLKVNTCIY